jgi:hypothetical protein
MLALSVVIRKITTTKRQCSRANPLYFSDLFLQTYCCNFVTGEPFQVKLLSAVLVAIRCREAFVKLDTLKIPHVQNFIGHVLIFATWQILRFSDFTTNGEGPNILCFL